MSRTRNSWPAGATAIMNATLTQGNAAGGAIVVEISPGSGNEFITMQAKAINSGTNGARINLKTAVGGTEILRFTDVASAAGTIAAFPQAANASTTSSNTGASFYPVIVSGPQAFALFETAAGAQSDTFQVLVNVRLRGGSLPTVTKANSTNPADVTVTAGALSFTVIP